MKDVHPLRRKSIKPSSSTIRGMLPGPQFRALDAAMQSLRSAGLRLDWQWANKDTGWVCLGVLDDNEHCRLVPTADPLLGQVRLTKDQQKAALKSSDIPEKFKKILKVPVEETKTTCLYEFELVETPLRDLFSNFVEVLEPVLSGADADG
jgi:hypothetical protein